MGLGESLESVLNFVIIFGRIVIIYLLDTIRR